MPDAMLPRHADELSPGTQVGGWIVRSLLGAGGMGTVYAAHHPKIGRHAALKVIQTEAAVSPAGVERFIQEARLVNQIRHPNIVDVIGFEELSDGRPVLVMELLEGETVASLLARQKRLTQDEALEVIVPVLGAVAAAHAAGVLHRDLKPDNLFVSRAPDGRSTVKVLDFGIAKLLDATADPALSASGARPGTPRFMSPEQCIGDKLDARSDLYSIGLILYEMLAGRGPYEGESAGSFFFAHVKTEPQRLGLLVTVNPALEAVVMRLLSKDRNDRPASASALLRELSAIAGPRASHSVEGLGVGAQATMYSAPPAAQMPPRGEATLDPRLDAQPAGAPAAAPVRIEENRLCTIVFADVSGFTAMSEKMEPEDVKEVIDGCFARMTAVIEKHGGFVDKYIGDCVMAVFGIPRSTDNDAERAVHAALALREAVSRFGARNRKLLAAGVELSLRVGVNTGVVFAGGVGARRDLTVTGDAVNVASRLQSGAPASSVVIGADTYRHVAGLFEVEALEPLRAKGKSEPVVWYRVLGIATHKVHVSLDEFHGSPTRFVGRRGEIDRVLDEIHHAVEGRRSRCLTVLGPPGIGKTRLRHEVQKALADGDDEPITLVARGSYLRREATYDLAASLLRARFGLGADDDREVLEQKLRNAIRSFGRGEGESAADDSDQGLSKRTASPGPALDPASLGDGIEILATMLGGRTGARLTAAGDSMDDLRTRIGSALAGLFRLLSTRAPVFILCDALESADDASLDLLDYLLVRLADVPFFVLACARPEFLERRPHWGAGSEAHTRLTLDPLSRRATEEMARDLLRRVRGLSPDFVRALGERADGNPFVLKETIQVLVQTGAISRTDDMWNLELETHDLAAAALPTTVRGIGQARLDRLAPDVRALVQQAAVVGRVFWEGALAATVSTTAVASSLRDLLERLRAMDIIRVRERSALQGEREYSFVDGITQEVAYASLSARSAARYHRAVAAWLEQRGPAIADGNPRLLADHYDRGEAWREAIAWYSAAGARAASLGHNADAIRLYERACEIADEQRGNAEFDEPEADRRPVEEVRVASWDQRVGLRLSLGDALRRLGRLEDADRRYREAEREILRTERRRGGTLDPHAIAHQDASVELRHGLVERVRGAHAEAFAHFVRARSHLGEHADPRFIASIQAAIAFALLRLDRHDDGLAACREGLAATRKIPAGEPERADLASRLLTTMGGFAYVQGKLVRAERLYRQASRVADEKRHPEIAARALNNVAVVVCRAGDFARARDIFRHSLELKERIGDLAEIVVACGNLAETELFVGNVSEAADRIRRAIEIAEALGAKELLPEVYRIHAEILRAKGELMPALRVAWRAFEHAQAPMGRPYLAATATTLCECCRASGGVALGEVERAEVVTLITRARTMVPSSLTEAGLENEAATCRAVLATIGA